MTLMYYVHVKCYPCRVVVMRTLILGSMTDTAGRPELVSVWGAHRLGIRAHVQTIAA